MDLVSGIIGLATSICNLIGTETLLKYPTQLADLQQQLIAEQAKGFDSDDAKIESLYQQINVIREAIQNEIALLSAGKAQTPAASPTVDTTAASVATKL